MYPPTVEQVLNCVPRKDPGTYKEYLSANNLTASKAAREAYRNDKENWNELAKVFVGFEKELETVKLKKDRYVVSKIVDANLSDSRIPYAVRAHRASTRKLPASCLTYNRTYQNHHNQPSKTEALPGVILCYK